MLRLGSLSQKLLLLLGAGVALGFANSPRRYDQVIKALKKEFRGIDQRALSRSIRRLYEAKLIKYQELKDGSIKIILNKEGKKTLLHYKIDDLAISKPPRWDAKWRVVLFDVPEDQKELRDALRMRFKRLGLIELQKSVFVHPYDCRNEIDFIIEFFDARRYVRFIEALHIDNELHLKKKFSLL